MQFVQSGTTNPVHHCTAIAHSSGYTVKQTLHLTWPATVIHSVTSWTQDDIKIECSFGLLTKNVWWFKRLWNFFCRKWNLQYKFMLCVTLQYDKTAWDIFTYSMEQNPSWETNCCSASQEILQFLRILKFHYHIHNYLPSVYILSFSVKNWNHETFLWWEAVSTLPNPQAGGIPLVCCSWRLIQYIQSHPPYWRQFFPPQSKDVPCRGDMDPLIRQN